MKTGDKVYVNWPTGKGGPYEIQRLSKDFYNGYMEAVVLDNFYVPLSCCEPAEPEIEEGRLVKGIKANGDIVYGELHYSQVGGSFVNNVKVNSYNIIPMYCQWNELSSTEKSRVNWFIGASARPETVFKAVYELITGEEHP